MSAPTRQRPSAPPSPSSATPARVTVPVLGGLTAGLAVLLAGAPVSAIVSDVTWFGDALLAVATVVGLGLLLHRTGPFATVLGQLVGMLLLLSARFGDDALFGVLPGRASFDSFGALLSGAGQQIAVGVAPIAPTPEILFLVTGAFGLVMVAVYIAAVLAQAPAAAGVPLLAMFAVPAALSDELLPWPAVVGACAGFGVLLLARDGAARHLPGGVVIVAGATALALGVGAFGVVGTEGRFLGAGTGAGTGGAIGLSPFTALRGQLTQADPQELFHVAGLPQATYLRALTLRTFVAGSGWQPSRPEPGSALPGEVATDPGDSGQDVTVAVTDVGFRDYWLPLVGTPLRIDAVPGGQWFYDPRSGTAYATRPREDSWQERAALAAPSADDLRSATGAGPPGQGYLDAGGVDPRVAAIASTVVGDRTDAFDKTMALQEYFTGPGSTFRYNLTTKPGNGDDALVEFLTTGRQGYCEQFASAMAVMLRTVGVPARVAVGFTAGRPAGDYRSITTTDAHAWVEAWFPGFGWTTFDPTPLTDGRTVVPPYVAQAEAQEAGTGVGPAQDDPALAAQRQREQNQGAATPTPTPSATPDAAVDHPGADVPVGLLATVATLLVVAALVLFPAAVRTRTRRRRLAVVAEGGPDAAGAGWAELLAESIDREVPTRASDTVRATARRLVREHGLDADTQEGLRTIVGAVEASWYGGLHPAQVELAGAVERVRAGIAAGTPSTLRARFMPRSVLAAYAPNDLRRRAMRRLRRMPKTISNALGRAVRTSAVAGSADSGSVVSDRVTSDSAVSEATVSGTTMSADPDGSGGPHDATIPARTGGGNVPPSGP